jgi:hypothetical protein
VHSEVVQAVVVVEVVVEEEVAQILSLSLIDILAYLSQKARNTC